MSSTSPIAIPSSSAVNAPSPADLYHALSTAHMDIASLSPGQIAQLRDLVAASAARAAATEAGETSTATNATVTEAVTAPIVASASFASEENGNEEQEEGVVHSAPLPIKSDSSLVPPTTAAPHSYLPSQLHTLINRLLTLLLSLTPLLLAHLSRSPRLAKWFMPNTRRYELEESKGGLWIFGGDRFVATNAAVKSSSSSSNGNGNHSDNKDDDFFSSSSYFNYYNAPRIPPPPCSPSAYRLILTIHGYLGLPRPFATWHGLLQQQRAEGEEPEQCQHIDYAYDSGSSMSQISSGMIEVLREEIMKIKKKCGETREVRVDFICHSMGGLVLRSALNSSSFPIRVSDATVPSSDPISHVHIGRIVTIATPHQGSEYARRIGQYPLLKSIVLGFAKLRIPGAAWVRGIPTLRSSNMTSSSSSSSTSAIPDISCGDTLMSYSASWFRVNLPLPRSLYPNTLVIAGTMSLIKGLGRQATDGTITFAETKLPLPEPIIGNREGEQPQFIPSSSSSPVSAGPAGSQHMSFHMQHSLLLMHPGVMAATMRFLRSGRAD